jgi:uncharacterized membrane protein YdbT with pleckstrin-like domain
VLYLGRIDRSDHQCLTVLTQEKPSNHEPKTHCWSAINISFSTFNIAQSTFQSKDQNNKFSQNTVQGRGATAVLKYLTPPSSMLA